MTHRTLIALLIGLIWSITALSQDVIKVDILPTKVSTDIKLLVYSEQTIVLERYHFFKYIYWMRSIDTLETLDNGVLKNKAVAINPETFRTTVHPCDTIVNKIRNSAFQERMSSELRNLAHREIGYDSQELTNTIDVRKPTKYQITTTCHEEFKLISKKWFVEQSGKIDEIKENKTARLAWIKANPHKINSDFIKSFLSDYGTSDIDQAAILDIIKFKTDDFLMVCKNMSDIDFYKIKLNLSILPDSLRTNEAIEKLKNSTIRTNRKGKLIKKLKKNAQ